MEESKKHFASLYILEILKRYTDENHRMTQAQILEKLKTEYKMEPGIKALRVNMKQLTTDEDFHVLCEKDDYVQKHFLMFSGENAPITMKIKRYILNDVIDYFGTDIRIQEKDDAFLTVSLNAGEQDVVHWAVQFAGDATVLSPRNVREEVMEKLKEAIDHYNTYR